jgi:hypothetical protein
VQVDDEPKTAAPEPVAEAEVAVVSATNGRPRKRPARGGAAKKDVATAPGETSEAEVKKPRRSRAKKSG